MTFNVARHASSYYKLRMRALVLSQTSRREAMEVVRVQMLLHFIPCVFRRAETPDGMEFILGFIRNAICDVMSLLTAVTGCAHAH